VNGIGPSPSPPPLPRWFGPRASPDDPTGELATLRQEVELPHTPIHGDDKLGNVGERSDGSWVTFDLDFARVRERLYDLAASLHHVAQDGGLLEPHRLLDAYERTAPEPLTRDEHRWLPGALALIPLHWAATAGLVGDGIHDAERAMTAAEAWWSRRAELSSSSGGRRLRQREGAPVSFAR
jgi:Ser/Thr protein kinase RdoA (MazF antagonist)